MEKDKVEEGDIWQHRQNKDLLYITEVGSNYIDFIGQKNENGMKEYFANNFTVYDKRYSNFTKTHKFIGKAFTTIDEIFKVEDN